MDSQVLIKVVNDHFQEDPEVFECAMYALSSLTVNDAVLRGIMNKDVEVKGIPPEAFHIMKRFDNGLTLNKFWLENFAPIKMQLALDDIKLNTMRHYIVFGEKEGDRNAFVQAKTIMLSRFDVLTTIAFLYKGVEFAEDFDAKVRINVQLTLDHDKYFVRNGVS